jgi:DnaK suppressor protein
MTPEDQARFRPIIDERLRALDAEIAGTAQSTEVIAPDAAIGRLSRLDAMQAQQIALAGKRRLEEERMRLGEALARIEMGSFGRCLRCGQDIALERLEYQPDALICVPCANRPRR